MSTPARSTALLVGALFFFSGFAALVYQVVWMRQFALFLGSDVYAAAITLSVFMGGLSFGSWLAGKFADRLARPLLGYGLIEVAIGLYALAFAALLQAFLPALREVYREATPIAYQAARLGLAAALLVLPTTLMGMTLPLIVGGLVQRSSELGRRGGTFYALNTLGAFAGTLVAAFALIPTLGIARTTHVAVWINLVAGVIVALIGLKPRLAADRRLDEEKPVPFDVGTARVALWAIGISGLAALALEVVWTRILTLSFSGTVYSFAIMLASFLFGIFYGSRRAARTIDADPDPVRTFAYLELGLGFSVALLALFSVIVPAVFGQLVWGLTRVTGQNFAAGSLLAQAGLALLLMFVPTALLGATFPAAVRVCTPDARRAGEGTARVYAANTAGAIVGALLAGFVLIPAIGSRASLVVLAAVFAANGLLLLRGRRDAKAVIALGGTALVGIIALVLPRPTVANYAVQTGARPERIYHGEGVAHAVGIVRAPNRDIIMLVDGNPEADTSFIQRRHFILKAHLPLLLHAAPREVAVVGLGLGITLAATERNPEVESIQLIELTPEMPKAHRHLDEITGGVLRKPKVNLRIDDGRNFLAMTDRRFDMITADPIHPRISGVGYLYTDDYYRTLRDRLKTGGIVCQWMPMYHISRESFDVAFRTFARVFEHASFWYVRGHGLFVASTEPFHIDYARLCERFAAPAVAQDLASIEINRPEDFLAHLLMGPTQIRAYLAASPSQTVNTDDNAHLEYATPFEYLHPTRDIVAALEPYAGFDAGLLQNVSDAERAAIRKAWDTRRAKLLSELDEKLR
jgi:spermidine synthase